MSRGIGHIEITGVMDGMLVSLPNSYIDMLNPSVMVFCGGAHER